MVVHMINPGEIKAGDQLTLQNSKGDQIIGTVARNRGGIADVECEDGFHRVRFSGRGGREFQIVGHQPRLV